MKTNTIAMYALCLLFLMPAASSLQAQSNYEQVARMWLNGRKQEVYCIATNRLAANTNDLAGLVMKLSYELAFAEAGLYTNTIRRLIAVGSGITTTNFASLYPILLLERDGMDQVMSAATTNELAQWSGKSSITNKLIGYRRFLQALEADGLWGN